MDDIHVLGSLEYLKMKHPCDAMYDSCLPALSLALLKLRKSKNEIDQISFEELIALLDHVKITIHFDRDMWDVRANLKLGVDE